jgi:hypothetical protein
MSSGAELTTSASKEITPNTMKSTGWGSMVFLIGLALVAWSTTAYHRPSSQGPHTPAITNKTTAVEVVSIKPLEPSGYEMTMRNVSKKNINGYSLGFDGGASVTSDLTSTYKPIIGPGEQFTMRLPATTSITVRHVVFDDNSSDGDATAAAQLQDRRLGIQEQLKVIVSLLNKERTDLDLEQLKSQITELPDQSSSVYVAAGMRSAKQDALLALQKLDNNNKDVGLTKLVEESNKRIARLRAKPLAN